MTASPVLLKPTGKPAQQLMSLLWAEDNQQPAYGRIFTSTYRLLSCGFVISADGLTVRLTDSGRAEARRLSATEAGKTYMAEGGKDE